MSNTAWRAEGGGIMVHANGMRMLRPLNLDTAVEGTGTRVSRWRFCDQTGEILFESDLEALWDDVGPCIGIERMQLQQVLVAGVEGVPCRLGTSIRSLIQHDDRASVTFSDGSSRTYDLVVGADGISSTVRALRLNRTPPAYNGAIAWRSVAPTRPHGFTSLQFLLGDGCFFGLCPLGDGRTYGFGNVTQPRVHEPMTGQWLRFLRHLSRLNKRLVPAAEETVRILTHAVKFPWSHTLFEPRQFLGPEDSNLRGANNRGANNHA